MNNLFKTSSGDSFTQQLEDLQRRYAQSSMAQLTAMPRAEKHEFKRVPDIEAAKAWARDNLANGESCPLFDEEKDVFYGVSKSQDGVLQKVLVCPYTMEMEPAPPEYATKQDLAKLEGMLQKLLEKEAKA